MSAFHPFRTLGAGVCIYVRGAQQVQRDRRYGPPDCHFQHGLLDGRLHFERDQASLRVRLTALRLVGARFSSWPGADTLTPFLRPHHRPARQTIFLQHPI